MNLLQRLVRKNARKRFKKPERNLGVIKSNIDVVKGLMEARTVENEVVMLDRESSGFVEGRVRGNETTKPMTPLYGGETFLYGLCDTVSTINIMPSSFYEELRYNLNNPEVEPIDTIIQLSNRVNIRPEGDIKNIYVFVGSYMYPLDFHVIDMPRDSFRPILLGRSFIAITKAQIDDKRETISMQFGEEEMTFHFAKLKKRPYE